VRQSCWFGRLCTHGSFVAVSFKPQALTEGEIVMKNIGKLFLVLSLLTVGGGIVANAQVASVPEIEVDIPFAFEVGDTSLPAGKYQIKALDDAANDLIEIRSAKNRTSVVFATLAAELQGDRTERKTELVFNKVAGQYFLNQIWVAGSSIGNELYRSKKEKRLTDSGNDSEKQAIAANVKRQKR
jgi:hypothetical protein